MNFNQQKYDLIKCDFKACFFSFSPFHYILSAFLWAFWKRSLWVVCIRMVWLYIFDFCMRFTCTKSHFSFNAHVRFRYSLCVLFWLYFFFLFWFFFRFVLFCVLHSVVCCFSLAVVIIYYWWTNCKHCVFLTQCDTVHTVFGWPGTLEVFCNESDILPLVDLNSEKCDNFGFISLFCRFFFSSSFIIIYFNCWFEAWHNNCTTTETITTTSD